ncbi:MAG: DUF2147 domain-containing protein [Beijerinckiaceae bacterium]
MKNFVRGGAAAFAFLALAASPALADPSGTWLRDNGQSRVRISPCGGNFCGTIVWLKEADSKSKVGQRVFYDMAPAGSNKWSGKAFNPEDGKTYSGTMTLSGSSLTTSGCVLGGMICRSVNWRKVN